MIMTIEELLTAMPCSIGISKLIPKDKMMTIVDDYQVQLMQYHGRWNQLKDFYGNDLQELLEKALQWCNDNNIQ